MACKVAIARNHGGTTTSSWRRSTARSTAWATLSAGTFGGKDLSYVSSAGKYPVRSTGPGRTIETPTALPRSSIATHWVNPTTANLEAEYALSPGVATLPATDAMLTMWPRRRSIMPGSTARVP